MRQKNASGIPIFGRKPEKNCGTPAKKMTKPDITGFNRTFSCHGLTVARFFSQARNADLAGFLKLYQSLLPPKVTHLDAFFGKSDALLGAFCTEFCETIFENVSHSKINSANRG